VGNVGIWEEWKMVQVLGSWTFEKHGAEWKNQPELSFGLRKRKGQPRQTSTSILYERGKKRRVFIQSTLQISSAVGGL